MERRPGLDDHGPVPGLHPPGGPAPGLPGPRQDGRRKVPQLMEVKVSVFFLCHFFFIVFLYDNSLQAELLIYLKRLYPLPFSPSNDLFAIHIFLNN